MFGIFTKNLDTMQRANTKGKKNLKDLNDVDRIRKQDLEKILGGGKKEAEKKKSKSLFGGWFSPCEGDLPQ